MFNRTGQKKYEFLFLFYIFFCFWFRLVFFFHLLFLAVLDKVRQSHKNEAEGNVSTWYCIFEITIKKYNKTLVTQEISVAVISLDHVLSACRAGGKKWWGTRKKRRGRQAERRDILPWKRSPLLKSVFLIVNIQLSSTD